MARLTYRDAEGYANAYGFPEIDRSELLLTVFERLCAYEETEKEWHEIAALRAELDAFKADIEAGRLVRLPCGVGDTVYDLWYSPCHHGETYPDSSGCCGCEDECDMKRVVRPVQFRSIQQILAHWSDFESGWYYTTEEAARAALEGGQQWRSILADRAMTISAGNPTAATGMKLDVTERPDGSGCKPRTVTG